MFTSSLGFPIVGVGFLLSSGNVFDFLGAAERFYD